MANTQTDRAQVSLHYYSSKQHHHTISLASPGITGTGRILTTVTT